MQNRESNLEGFHNFCNGYYFDLGMMSTAASLGLLLLWDVDGGLTQIDKYLYSNEDFIKVRNVFRLSV